MFRTTDHAIDLAEIVRYVTDPQAGAIATFIGTTRNHNDGRRVIALDYEAYRDMAEKELARIGADLPDGHRTQARTGADRRGERCDCSFLGAPRCCLRRQPLCNRRDKENRADLEKGSVRGW